MNGPEDGFPDPYEQRGEESSHPPKVEIYGVPVAPPPTDDAGGQNYKPPIDLKPPIENEQKKGHIGLIGGLLIIFAGIAMIFGGVTGSIDLVFKSGGSQLHIATAVIGIVVCLIGFGVIYVTEPKVKIFFAGADKGRQ